MSEKYHKWADEDWPWLHAEKIPYQPQRVIFPIGISGAGKDRFYRMFFKEAVLLSPDNIRKELTGDISDQTRNKEVFEILHDRMRSELDRCVNDIYLSETHLWLPGLKQEVEMALPYGKEILFYLFEDSRNWKLCQSRVRGALASGEDRSATADVIGKSGKPLLEEMSERYVELVESEDFKKLTNGHFVHKII